MEITCTGAIYRVSENMATATHENASSSLAPADQPYDMSGDEGCHDLADDDPQWSTDNDTPSGNEWELDRPAKRKENNHRRKERLGASQKMKSRSLGGQQSTLRPSPGGRPSTPLGGPSAPGNRSRSPIAPRSKYVRLAFPQGKTEPEKLAWWKSLTTTYAERDPPIDVVRPDLRSPFIYVGRREDQLQDALLQGKVGGIKFINHDRETRNQRFKEYLVTGYPTNLPLSIIKDKTGVHSVRRIKKNGMGINRVIVVWNGDSDPPNSYRFLYGPPSHIRLWKPGKVMCFKCQRYGHVKLYCANSLACPLCAGSHTLANCPRKKHQHSSETNDGDDGLPPLKCARCDKSGVTAWHSDCSRGRREQSLSAGSGGRGGPAGPEQPAAGASAGPGAALGGATGMVAPPPQAKGKRWEQVHDTGVEQAVDGVPQYNNSESEKRVQETENGLNEMSETIKSIESTLQVIQTTLKQLTENDPVKASTVITIEGGTSPPRSVVNSTTSDGNADNATGSDDIQDLGSYFKNRACLNRIRKENSSIS